MDQTKIAKPDPGYRYEFVTSELEAMSTCLSSHGFAILKGVLSDDFVERLKQAVWDGTDPNRTLQRGESKTRHAWIESGSGAWSLLQHESYMDIHRHVIGADELTVNRSAAIVRMPDSAAVNWHCDWGGFYDGPPKSTGNLLNSGPWPSGSWFYLTGSRPAHGGLCVIEDSHVEGWEGPDGFVLTPGRASFYPEGEEPTGYGGFDVPGIVPLFADPGDLILFAHRTYHGAFPNRIDEARLSCAMVFRDRNHRIDIPWEIPEPGRKFLKELPPHLHRYVDGYTSIDPQWKG